MHLANLLQLSNSANTLSGSAAVNWGSLADRMNFLVDFFRSYQHYKPLFERPFLDSQIPVMVGRYSLTALSVILRGCGKRNGRVRHPHTSYRTYFNRAALITFTEE